MHKKLLTVLAMICLLSTNIPTVSAALYFIQPDKSAISGMDLGPSWTDQKLSCADFVGLVSEITIGVETSYSVPGAISFEMRVAGFSGDTFIQTSDTIVGEIGTTTDYTFTFNPPIDIQNTSGLCDLSNDFLIGIKKSSGGYIAGKVLGTTNPLAYRDADTYKCFNCSTLADLYFEVNPANYVPPLYFIQPDKSTVSGMDLGSSWTEQKLSCADFQGVIDQIETSILTSTHPKGAISYVMNIRGFGGDSFQQTSNIVAGVKNTTKDYQFTFNPPIDVRNTAGLCNLSQDFLVGVKRSSGGYITGKVLGTTNPLAYRDADTYKCFNCSILADLYFEVNPANAQ